MKQRHFPVLLAALAASVALAVYLPALRNDFVNWDDNVYVTQNPYIRTLGWKFLWWAITDSSVMYWHPIAKISHALDYALYGLRPLGHHLTSIMLHAANTFLVFMLAVRLGEVVKNRSCGREVAVLRDSRSILLAGGVTALLFGIHPLQVESVAWISERKTLLSALLYLLSLHFYVLHASLRSSVAERAEARLLSRSTYYLLSLGCFLLALASKPMAVTLPLVLMILDWYPFGRMRFRHGRASIIMEKVPFLVCSAVVSVATYLAQRSLGSLASYEQLPLSSRILVACSSIGKYLGKMVLPVDLMPLYAYSKNVSFWTYEYGGAVVLVLVITAGCLAAVRPRPYLLALWAYFLVSLLPVLGLVQAGMHSMADRFVYLPSLGPFSLVGLASSWMWEKGAGAKGGPFLRSLFLLGGAAVALSLVYATEVQIGTWRNAMTLWNEAIRKEPGASFPYVGRGRALEAQGMRDQAIEDYSRAIELDMTNYLAYSSRGEALRDVGRLDDALEDLSTAITLNPGVAALYMNRGITFADKGDMARAIEDLDESLRLQPLNSAAHMNRGIIYARRGQLEEAIADLSAAIRLNPVNYLAYTNRGTAYADSGQRERAEADYAVAIAIAPERGEAFRQRGILHRDAKRVASAIEDLTVAIGLQPGRADNYVDRASCYRQIGAIALAEADEQKACALGSVEGCGAARSAGRGSRR